MYQSTLLIGAIFSLASAGIYFYVGRSLSRRLVIPTDARLAWNLFVVWWYALAGSSLSTGILSLLGSLGLADLPLLLTFTQVNLLAVCLALYGLMYYLLFLFTGSRKMLIPLTAFYIVYYTLLTYYLNWLEPVSISLGRWNTSLVYQKETAGPFFVVLLMGLVLPQIIGSIAYFSMYFRVKEATQKYRVALVSWSILIWFSSALLASISGLSQHDWWQIVSRMVGLGAALTILMAYQPFRWIKKRLGVASISEERS